MRQPDLFKDGVRPQKGKPSPKEFKVVFFREMPLCPFFGKPAKGDAPATPHHAHHECRVVFARLAAIDDQPDF